MLISSGWDKAILWSIGIYLKNHSLVGEMQYSGAAFHVFSTVAVKFTFETLKGWQGALHLEIGAFLLLDFKEVQ